MRMQNAKQDVQLILSWFSGTFSSPSFKLFSSFIVGFIQLGKEVHTSRPLNNCCFQAKTLRNPLYLLNANFGKVRNSKVSSSMVQSVSGSFLQRSLSCFTRFLGKNAWAMKEVLETALHKLFHTLRIKPRSLLFLLLDDTIVGKTGKKIPGCVWYKDHAQNLANVFAHQWVLSALLYKTSLLPLWARLYHPKKVKGCGRFQTKIRMAQEMLNNLKFPLPCNLYLLADS